MRKSTSNGALVKAKELKEAQLCRRLDTWQRLDVWPFAALYGFTLLSLTSSVLRGDTCVVVKQCAS